MASPTSLRSRVLFATLLFVVGASQQAIAAKPFMASRVQAREREAKTACLSGDYVKGIAILAAIYVQTDDPVHLFNQWRCYEQNVRYVEASERFREFLRKAGDLPADVRAIVDQHITDCDAAIARTHPRPSPADIASPPPSQVEPMRPPAVQKAAREEPLQPAAAPLLPTTFEHPWQHTAKWVASGAAVAFLGLGVFEHVRYYRKNHDYNKDPKCYYLGQCEGLADAADTARLVSIVGYSAAAAATGLAIWFWLADEPRPVPAQPARISFACWPTLTGAACSGRF